MRPLTIEQQRKLETLLSEMTVEEKIGQLHQISPSIVGGFDVSFEELIEMMTDGRISQEEFGRMMAGAERDFHDDLNRAGGLSSVLISDPETANRLQKIAVEESRLGIPLIFGFDVIHGYRTVVPIALAEAGTFEPELMEKSARIAALESRAEGISWHFSPMLDISRDARWGRISEGPGEDPYLASVFAKAKVRGQQNAENPADCVASCLKHYVAYGACESGRDYNTVSMAPSMLHNAYLPPFFAAVKEGAATVMASFNDLNGVPCTMNPYTLRTILKEGYGFDGFVVSDANAIKECITHGYAADEADAAKKALSAGMDMDMNTWIYNKELPRLLEEGAVSMADLDDAVRRILSVKLRLGLFEKPYVTEEEMHRYDTLPKEHLDHALEVAEKSIVLLKNEGNLLPLKKNTKISLVGGLADMPGEVLGSWAISGRAKDCVTIRRGLENAGAELSYFPCCLPDSDLNEEEISAAIAAGDVLVAVVGEYAAMSGEASSRSDITLPGKQQLLLEKLLESGKPVVALLMNGRPLALSWETEHVPAIMECWHLGVRMGDAVANVLFGDANPSGKLSCTFPRVTGQCPIYYNAPKTGRPGSKSKFTSRYLDVDNGPLYPFGYGISYTTFSIEDLRIEETTDALAATVTVKNTGSRYGSEVLQLYMHDVAASLVRPAKELKGFEKVWLQPGEEKDVTIVLEKKDMGFYDDAMNYRLEDGDFVLYVGKNSADCLTERITVKFN